MKNKKYRDINEIYKELVNHPDFIFFDCWDIDDVSRYVIGDIKNKSFIRKIKNRIRLKKDEIGKELWNFYFNCDGILNTKSEIIMCSGFFDDIIDEYPNYDDEY